jgi:hypothetical protein
MLSSGTLLTAAIKTTSTPSEHDEMFLVHIRQKEMLGQHFVGVSLRGALQKAASLSPSFVKNFASLAN